jgi:hypothetical protein
MQLPGTEMGAEIPLDHGRFRHQAAKANEQQ